MAGSGKFAFCSRVESGETIDSVAGPLWKHRLDQPDRLDRPRASANGNGKLKGKGHRTPQEAVASLARWLKGRGTDLGELTGSWPYHDSGGRPVLVVFRFDRLDSETGERSKSYRPVHRGDDGRWRSGDPEGPLPLYHLPELAEADLVVICEGEKAADAVRSLGLVATSPSHGAESPQRTDWSPLAGKTVVILPDNDEPGRAFGKKVVELLRRLAPRPTVKVVELPDLPPKGDAVEWIEAGGTKDALLKLIEGAGVIDPPPPGTAPEDEDDRPIIVVSTDIHLTIQKAVDAVAVEPGIYQRGNSLVTILRAAKGKAGRLEYREPGSPRIVPVALPRLAELLSRNARFVKYDGRSKAFVPAIVPKWCTEAIAARGEWPEVREIEGVVEAPTMRPDGTILDVAGWDEKTGLLYEPNGGFPSIPGRPTRADAKDAAGRLMGLVADFPFKSDEHRAAWLAGLLTVAARYAILGPVPMFLVNANVPGAGKTWLADLIAIIVAGREMPRSSYSRDDAEMAKVILSVALAAVRFVLFDNVPTGFKIGGGALDRALTGRTFQDRILGKSQMSPETPLDAVFFASGNNLGLRGDALRRVIPCELMSEHERPEERTDFRIPNIKSHAREHRGELLRDALVILRAHAVADRPASGLVSIGYPEWSAVVRDAIHWTTGLDPAAPRIEVRQDDDETQRRHALVDGWSRLVGRSAGKPLTAAEAVRALEGAPLGLEDVHDLLCGLSEDGKLPSSRRLGNALAKERGRPTPAGSLEFKRQDGNRAWYVRPPKHPARGSDSSDSSDSVFPTRVGDVREDREREDSAQLHGGRPESESLESLEPLGPPNPLDPDDDRNWTF
jgi:putative DNA primase/helicase